MKKTICETQGHNEIAFSQGECFLIFIGFTLKIPSSYLNSDGRFGGESRIG